MVMAAMIHGINRHLDDDELEQYSMGSLPESTADSLEEHLLLCEPCRQRLDKADSYTDAMRGAAAELRDRQRLAEAKPQRARGAWFRMVPALAGLALLVVVIGWWSTSSDLAGPPFAISLEATRGSSD